MKTFSWAVRKLTTGKSGDVGGEIVILTEPAAVPPCPSPIE